MSLQVTGKITHIGDVEVVSEKFSKRTFVIEVQDGAFAKNIAMQFTNDKCGKLDGVAIGSTVEIKFNLESREYNGKWYTNATAWYLCIAIIQAQQAPQAPQAVTNDVPNDMPF
jgi:hypothetical protein